MLSCNIDVHTEMIAAKLEAGQQAPPFELPDHSGKIHRLDQYTGQWLVLYFYPKDDSPLCTREACGFRDDMQAITALGARVVGVSLDSPQSHAAFAERHGLGFPLLSDTHGDAARRYGAYFQVACLRLAKRHTFIIDPRGRIARVYRSVASGRHSSQIIDDLRTLQDSPPARDKH